MDKKKEIQLLKNALFREKKARKQAEGIMELKSLELYETNKKLKVLNEDLKFWNHQKEREFQNIVESSVDIIFKIRLTGIFSYVNPATEEITGYSAVELLSMNFTQLVRPDYKRKLILHYLNQIETKQESSVIDFPIVNKNGREIWIRQTTWLIIFDNEVRELNSLARDITEIKKANENVIQSEEKYRGVIENLELGILEVDLNDKIIKAHPKFCQMVGYNEEELLGNSPVDLFLENDSKHVMLSQNKKRLNGHSEAYEIKIKKKNGDFIWTIISGAPFYDTAGNILGTIGLHLDITKRKTDESKLMLANEIAQASSKAKEMFLANMSHEIRTPLNAVIGLSQMLKKTELDNEQNNYVKTILKSADNLLLLVNNILDVSKIESGNINLEKTPFNFKKTIENIVASSKYQAISKGINLDINLSKKVNNYYLGDPLRLSQILINLINNGIKFTSKGYVKLNVTVSKSDGLNDLILIEVIDTGIGISKENIEIIFNKFKQANNKTSRIYGGTGLGLSICKELVELHNSQLKVRSELGKGSNFSFSISLNKTVKTNTKRNDFFDTIDWSKISILMAEDNLVNQFVALKIIESWGAKIDVVNNGEQAIEQLIKKQEYDLILMDVQMPILDGISATIQIRKSLFISTPIIALTANAIKGDKERYIKAGMNGYIAKPFKEIELKNELIRILNTQAVTSPSNEKKLNPLLNLEKINELSSGNKEFELKMLKIFLEEGNQVLKKMDSQCDNSTIKSLAHKIKPSIDYLSNTEMAELIRSVEDGQFIDHPEILQKFLRNFKKILSLVDEKINR